MCPNSIVIIFYNLNEFLMKKKLNIQNIFHCRLKHYTINSMHPYFIEGFPMIPRAWQKALRVGNFQHDKQNKKSTFLHNHIDPNVNSNERLFKLFNIFFPHVRCVNLAAQLGHS